MDWKTLFLHTTEKMDENKMEEETESVELETECQNVNVKFENVIDQMTDVLQKELSENMTSVIKKILSQYEEKYTSLCKVVEYQHEVLQHLLTMQVDSGNRLETLQDSLVKVAEKQEETILKQHNAALKFQEDVIYKTQKNLIMELIGIADNIRMILDSHENDSDFDLVGAVKDLGKWVDASLSNNSVRKYQDTDIDNTVFNRKRQELVAKEDTDDETKNGTYKTEHPGYVWSIPYVVVNSEVQLNKILEDNNLPQMFSYVIRPEEIVKLVYNNENKVEK